MPTVHLTQIMRRVATNSVRQLVLTTGSSERSVAKQAQLAAIDAMYRINEGYRGPFGFPVRDEFEGNTATRRYSAGLIAYGPNGPQRTVTVAPRVRFVGFRCIRESDWDQSSSSDEPYFIIGVASAAASKTVRFGPYGDIDTRDARFTADDIVRELDGLTLPLMLGVVAMEKDRGNPKEVEGKIRKAMEEIERKFDQAVAGILGVPTGSHVTPEWARDILIGWGPKAATYLLGLGDDEVGKSADVMFDYKADLLEWRAPAVIGKHGSNEYNKVVSIDGGKAGKYELYFKVDLFDIDISVRELEM